MNNDREPMSEALLAEIRERSRNRVVGLDIHVLIAEVERLQEELRYKEELLDKAVHQIADLSSNITWHE